MSGWGIGKNIPGPEIRRCMECQFEIKTCRP